MSLRDFVNGLKKPNRLHRDIVLNTVGRDKSTAPTLYTQSAAPSSPNIVRSFRADSGVVRFTFSVSGDTHTKGYNIYRGSTDNAAIAERVDFVSQPGETRSTNLLTWDDPYPDNSKQYYYVSAVNEVGVEGARVGSRTEFSPLSGKGTLVIIGAGSGDPTGTSDSRAAIATADASITSGSGMIIFMPGTYLVSSNITISSPVHLMAGAKLKPASGVTITINKLVTPGLTQIFDTSLGGTIVLAAGAAYEVRPQWWGAIGDDLTVDDTGIAAARTAGLAVNIPLVFAPGTYRHLSVLDFGFSHLHIKFEGTVVTKCTGTITEAVKIDGGSSLISNISIEGDGWIIEGSANVDDGLKVKNVVRSFIYCPRVREVTRHAFSIEGAVLVDFYHPQFSLNADASMTSVPARGLYVTNSAQLSQTTDCNFYNTIMEGAEGEGVYLSNMAASQFFGGTSEGNTTASGLGVKLLSTTQEIKFYNFFMESNTGGEIENAGDRNSFIGGAAQSRAGSAPFDSVKSIVVKDTAEMSFFQGFGAYAGTVESGATDTIFMHMNFGDDVNPDNGTRTQYIGTRQTFITSAPFNGIQPGNSTASASLSAPTKVLGWYLEGTFTPAWGGSTTNGSITYTSQVGRYTRIGNRVFFDIYLSINVLTTAPTGSLRINGLPYTADASARSSTNASASFIDLSATYTYVGGQIDASTNYISMVESGDNVATQVIQGAALTTAGVTLVSGHYEVSQGTA